MKYLMASVLILFSTVVCAEDKIPAREDVSLMLSVADKAKFDEEAVALDRAFSNFKSAGDAFSVKTAEAQTDEEFDALQAQRTSYIDAVRAFNKSLLEAEAEWIQASMIEDVQNSKWSVKEKERAINALNTLDEDGAASTSADVRQIWKDVQARRDNADLAREASQGKGPGMPGAGNQTIHEDCTIFALANAAGVPYGVAAARATEFIRNGKWRSFQDQAAPEKAIETGGLMGGEVIMVAEAFGEVRIVPSEDFVATLESGRPVMVDLVPYNGDMRNGHEVVLAKTFLYDGQLWFEMIDSNEEGASQRLYVNEQELGMMLKENGVSVIPDEKTVTKFLRDTETK